MTPSKSIVLSNEVTSTNVLTHGTTGSIDSTRIDDQKVRSTAPSIDQLDSRVKKITQIDDP